MTLVAAGEEPEETVGLLPNSLQDLPLPLLLLLFACCSATTLVRVSSCCKHLEACVLSADHRWKALCEERGFLLDRRRGTVLTSPPRGETWFGHYLSQRRNLCVECGVPSAYGARRHVEPASGEFAGIYSLFGAPAV